MRRFLTIATAAMLASACTVLVESELEGKGQPDSGTSQDDGGSRPDRPSGPRCSNTQQCLQIADRVFDCTQRCVEGVCVSDAAGGTPDGVQCGGMASGQICVGASCVTRECGDGFVDRMATPPEYCDDGNDNPDDACNNECTRSCVPPAPPNCDDGSVCNGMEMCDSGSGTCRASPPADDGTACMVGDTAGTCQRGACVVE